MQTTHTNIGPPMIQRRLDADLIASLNRFPVVGLIGARQVGKTTLARHVGQQLQGTALYLDLESLADSAKLAQPELYLDMHADKLVIIDEIQRLPALFPVLRALVDKNRRNGRFLILGSASPALIRQSAESLAGRIIYHELAPLCLAETGQTAGDVQRLWVRGGFPESYLSASDLEAATWRNAFVRTHLERDIPALGLRVAAAAMQRFWMMLAHCHGQLWNAQKIAASLGVSGPTARHYLDILQDTFMVRQLPPFHANIKKRLVKTPKVYLRDSGLLHSLLGLETVDHLLGHPGAGASWEGWVIEQICAILPASWKFWFYRTGAGAEIDLIVEPAGGAPLLAIEIKLAHQLAPSKGFWSALADLPKARGFVVGPVDEVFPLGRDVLALPVTQLERLKHWGS